jgi:hypothetical protein
MLPGSNAYNVRDARPRNRVGGPDTITQTTEMSGQGKFSMHPSLAIGTRRSTQEDILRHPIHFKYLQNPQQGFISSLWEFHVNDQVARKGQLDLEPGHRLLPGATFLEPIGEPHPVTVVIACYYNKGPFESRWLSRLFSLWKEWGGRVGWRNFCHETTIVMPFADWPNDEMLYRLHIDVPLSDDAMEEDSNSEICKHLLDGPRELIFSTSASNKAFVFKIDSPAYHSVKTSPRSEH